MRPYIICHMGMSIDGRPHPSRFTAAADVSPDVRRGHYGATGPYLGPMIGARGRSATVKGHAERGRRLTVAPTP
jgi:hypothetical protein